MKSAKLTGIPSPHGLAPISDRALHARIDHLRETYNQGRSQGCMRPQHKDFLKWIMSHALKHWASIRREKPKQWAALAAADCPALPFLLNRNQAARCAAIGVSVSTIDRWLAVLQDAGFIARRKARYIGGKKIIRLWISKHWLCASQGETEKTTPPPQNRRTGNQAFTTPETAKKPPIHPLDTELNIHNKGMMNVGKILKCPPSEGDKGGGKVCEQGTETPKDLGTNTPQKKPPKQHPEKKCNTKCPPSEGVGGGSRHLTWKHRFARALWQQAKTLLWKNWTFSTIDEQRHVDNMLLQIRWLEGQHLGGSRHRIPDALAAKEAISQALELAAHYAQQKNWGGFPSPDKYLDPEPVGHCHLHKVLHEWLPRILDRQHALRQRDGQHHQTRLCHLRINRMVSKLHQWLVNGRIAEASSLRQKIVHQAREFYQFLQQKTTLPHPTILELLQRYKQRVLGLGEVFARPRTTDFSQ